MGFVFLILFIVLLLALAILFLTKRFPNYFPKSVIIKIKPIMFFIFDIMMLYVIIASFIFSSSSSYVENGVKCYQGTFRYQNSHFNYDTCPKILNNLSQLDFIITGVVSVSIFFIVNKLFLQKNKELRNVLFREVDLLKDKKEGKMRKGFLPITLIITFIIIIIGYIFFSHL